MRLRTLIAISLLLAAAQTAAAQKQIGSFVLVEETDPVTDHNRSFVFTTAVDGGHLATAALVWRCDDERLELLVKADEYLDDDDVMVQWRFDSHPPSEARWWNPSTSGTAAFAPKEDMRLFTAEALRAREVVVRLWDYRSSRITYRFRLDGLAASLRRLPCVPTSAS